MASWLALYSACKEVDNICSNLFQQTLSNGDQSMGKHHYSWLYSVDSWISGEYRNLK